MREVLGALMKSHGCETVETITDTLPRDMLIDHITRLRAESKYNRKRFESRMEEEDPDENINTSAIDMDTLFKTATEFYRMKGIPPTRAFEPDHYLSMIKFILTKFPECVPKDNESNNSDKEDEVDKDRTKKKIKFLDDDDDDSSDEDYVASEDEESDG